MRKQSDLRRLRDLRDESPTTLMGMVRRAWPEIEAALAAGHSLKTVHARLAEDGVSISYRRLSFYLGRLRRGQTGKTQGQRSGSLPSETRPTPGVPSTSASDAANNLRNRLTYGRPGFDFKAGPPDEDKLI